MRMRRRTFIGSILASSISAFGVSNGLAQSRKSHIAVIGAGAFGGWTALNLLRSGAQVTLLDAWGPGHSRSSSGGESRVCQYTNTPDSDFIADRHPDADNVWLLGGGSGHGFKHGPALGEMVAAQVLGEKPVEATFALTRFEN